MLPTVYWIQSTVGYGFSNGSHIGYYTDSGTGVAWVRAWDLASGSGTGSDMCSGFGSDMGYGMGSGTGLAWVLAWVLERNLVWVLTQVLAWVLTWVLTLV